jgi:hypothetical protein
MDPRFTLSPEFDSEVDDFVDYSKLLTRESNGGPAGKLPSHRARGTPRSATGATSRGPADPTPPARKPAA